MSLSQGVLVSRLPAHIAGLSAIVLALQILRSSLVSPRPVRTTSTPLDADVSVSAGDPNPWVSNGARRTRYVLEFLRVICCSGVLALEVYEVFHSSPHKHDWHLFIVAEYCFVLALLAVPRGLTVPKSEATVSFTQLSWHLTVVLLALAIYYAQTTIWPFAKTGIWNAEFTNTAALLCSFIGGIVVPLFLPRPYLASDSEIPAGVEHEAGLEVNPEETISLFSFLTYSYLDPVILLANRVPHMSVDMLPPLMLSDRAKVLREQTFKWLDPFLSGGRRRHVLYGVVRFFAKDLLREAFWLALLPFAELVGPAALNQLLRYLEGQPTSVDVRPWVWIVLIFLGPFLSEIFMQNYISINIRAMVKYESIAVQLIFEHALRMRVGGFSSNQNIKPATTHNKGRLINLVTTDLTEALGGREVLMVVVYAALQIILGFAFLYNILGWASIVGVCVMVALTPVPTWSGRLVHRLQKRKMQTTDKRVQLVAESLGILRMIKLFAWSTVIGDQIQDEREEELIRIWQLKLVSAAMQVINLLIPFIYMVATYTVFTLAMHRDLSASIVFSSATVFDLIQRTFGIILSVVPPTIQAKVSFDRLNSFLWNTDTISAPAMQTSFAGREELIGFGPGTFSWGGESSTLTISGDVVFHTSNVNVILGPTGSGKTAVLMALLGEMNYKPQGDDGWVNLPRTKGIAYVAQQSWVLNDTVKGNILFGAPYDEGRYQKVLHQCALNLDLSLLDAGDLTEVGEQGITLSGGQKARITLARAVYSSAQVLLLDDILASLDTHTAHWIVENCLKGDLVKGRTVLLVTHNVAMTDQLADFVVTVDSSGEVKGHPSIRVAFEQSAATLQSIDQSDQDSKEASVCPSDESRSDRGRLIAKEEVKLGRIGRASFEMFLSAMGGRFSALFLTALIAMLFASELAVATQTWWLGHWSEAYGNGAVRVPYYLSVYVALALSATAIYGFAAMIQARGSIRASKTLHQNLLQSVFHSTFRWLDRTPSSRILTRCTQDINAVDTAIPRVLFAVLTKTARIFIRLAAVVAFTPAFLVPGLFVAAIGAWIGQVYLRAQLSVKREMANAKSPIVGLFGEGVADLVSVRAYGAQEIFKERLQSRIDTYSRAARTFWNVNRWIRFRMYLLSNVFSTALAAYMLYASGDRNPVDVGFSLSMAMAFSSGLLWWIRDFNELEVQANSLERIHQYLLIDHEPTSTPQGLPPAHWPSSGALSVANLSARYSPDGPKVLDDLTFDLISGERIGIVGRTGSGKSSLTLSLLRAIFTEGTVCLDGIDTNTINIETLRSSITYIPQSPELLSGTLRRNLDLVGEHDDARLNSVLQAVGLHSLSPAIAASTSTSLDGNAGTPRQRLALDSSITSGGANLSMGERQLVALARAMLRESKLLILDEATSALDYETDALVQHVLRDEFQRKGITVLTVAHRLRTIMDADRIMVLQEGKMMEFDSPATLMAQDGSLFRGLILQSHDASELLKNMKS